MTSSRLRDSFRDTGNVETLLWEFIRYRAAIVPYEATKNATRSSSDVLEILYTNVLLSIDVRVYVRGTKTTLKIVDETILDSNVSKINRIDEESWTKMFIAESE